MGNFASTALVSCSDYSVNSHQTSSLWSLSTTWLATAVASVKTAVISPAATTSPATDDCDLLAMARPDLWELCANVVKAKDDDCKSCTTDATDALTDSESDHYSESEDDSESEDEVDDAFFDAVDDVACVVDTLQINEEENCNTADRTTVEEESASDCHCYCNALVERLYRIAAAPSSSSAKRTLVFLDDYMCSCGECPNAKRIASDVEASGLWMSEQHKRSLTRLLQAFATYNEVVGYDCEMLAAASECLHMWEGDEDHAFTAFVLLFE